jgi:threonine dehydratase
MSRPGISDVRAARRRIADTIRRTPVYRSAWLSDLTGGDVWLKLESLQVTHSFKIRGALNAVRRFAETRAGHATSTAEPPLFVTASAGNHGVALALAARRAGVRALVFAPGTAPRTKLEAIGRYGAELDTAATDYDAAERAALAFSAERGVPYLSPYNHPDVIAGAGTVALEVLEDVEAVDAMLVCVGGGGLVSGIGIAAKALSPATEVIGVEAAVNPAFRVALANGRITEIPTFPTIADGLGGNLEPGSMTFEIARDVVDRWSDATEDELRRGMRELVEREHLVAEGAGVAALGALLAGKIDVGGRRVVVVVSGANVDVATLRGVLD